ncbi:MAG: hypothetical protein ACLFV7_02795 [Phycisphaerae bacterium]
MIRRGIVVTVLVALAATTGLAQSGGAAVDKLDSKQLADQLEAYGMTELLEALIEQGADANSSPETNRMLAKAKTARAVSATFEDPARRARLVDEAAELLRQVIKDTADAEEWRDELAYYRDRLKLAELLGSVRIKPEADAIMYLYGTPLDRKTVQKYSSEAVKMLARLRGDLDDRIDDLSDSGFKGLLRVRHYKQVLDEVRYLSGWVYFYNGMSAEDDRAASAALRRSVADIEKFATGGAESGIKYWSLLLVGMAKRELHDHKVAVEYLEAAGVEVAEPLVRMQASFEIGRNLAEWGNYLYERSKVYQSRGLSGEAKTALDNAKVHFADAEKAVDEFRKLTASLLKGEQAALQADIYATILANYIYDVWAEAVEPRDPEQAENIGSKGIKAVLGFLDRHEDPGVQQFLIDRIAGKFRGRTDYENMPSIFVFSIALKELNEAEKLWETQRSKATEIYNKISKMMEVIQGRTDEASRRLKARVGKVLAYIDYKLGNELAAARKNLALAKEDPTSADAYTAATNALKIYRKMVEQRPSAALKMEFVKALRFFLDANDGAWAKKAPQWHFDLAWQLESLADSVARQQQKEYYEQAVKAYEAVPETTPEYMQARYRGLSIQMTIIDEFEKGNVQQARARRLVESVHRFVDEARTAIRKEESEQKKADMREWAARTAFEAAVMISEVLGQDKRALELMRDLPRDWPGTRVLQFAAAFRIQKLVEEGDVKTAIDEVEAYRQKYGDRKSRGLIRSVISKVRERIKKLREERTNPRDLALYRDVYARFAENLYESSKDKSPQQRYPLKQMYADAMLEKGYSAQASDEDPTPHFKKALTLFKELKAADDAEREQGEDKIAGQFDQYMAAARAAEGNRRETISVAGRYLAKADQEGYSSVSKVILEDSLATLRDAMNEKAMNKALEETRFQLKKFLKDFRGWMLNTTEVDGANVLGLARANYVLGNLEEAEKHYVFMVRNMASDHPQYWDVQMEYCRLVYRLHKDKANVMEQLATHIKSLQVKDPTMGGQRLQFNELLKKVGG